MYSEDTQVLSPEPYTCMRSFSLAGVTPSVFTKHECTSAAVVQGQPYRIHGPHLNGEGLSHSRDRPCRLCRRDNDPTGQLRTVVTVKRSETIPPVRFVLGCSAHLPCTPFQDGASSPTSSPRGSEAQCSSGHSPMPLAWPTGAKYYHQRWALAGGGGVLRCGLVLKTLQE